MRYDHFVPQLTEQPADPRGMGSCLQGHETPRYFSKGLLHRFRCRRQFLFQNDLACFIQNTVERPAISEVQTNRELVSFENHVSIYPNSASLFHSRSPFLCALSTSNIGSVSHPAGDRPSHPICEVLVRFYAQDLAHLPRQFIRTERLLDEGCPATENPVIQYCVFCVGRHVQ